MPGGAVPYVTQQKNGVHKPSDAKQNSTNGSGGLPAHMFRGRLPSYLEQKQQSHNESIGSQG